MDPDAHKTNSALVITPSDSHIVEQVNGAVVGAASEPDGVDSPEKKAPSCDNLGAEPQQSDNTVNQTGDRDTSNVVEGGRGSRGRRVKFPVDSTIVSGYMDPPNPWHKAGSCSTDDLISAYKKACEKHNVRPMAKLLNQLHGITEFKNRNETFSLRGDKLDHKQVETLEEVLRRVQFNMFDLEATHLDDDSAVALFDMIEYYESCTKLNVAYNRNIGPRGWQSCARMMKKTPCMEYLDARHCLLTEQTMPLLGRSLRMGSMLATLHLENCSLSGRPLLILVAAVKMNETLKELFLADNRLMPSDGIQLGNMLKFNHKLSLLDVRNNHLQDVGTSHLCDGLFEQNLGFGLGTVVLWNNQVTYQAMPSLARALSSTRSLETLNLGHNNLTNEGIHRLKDGLMQNRSLLRIGLQAARIGCEGAVALAEFVAESPRLLRIDLRENDIKTGGLMALSLSLKVSQSVTKIDLDKEPKKENGVKDYIEQQKRLHEDISTYMQRNRDLAQEKERQEEQERQQQEEQQRQAELEAAAAAAAASLVEETVNDSGAASSGEQKKPLKLHLPLSTGAPTLESPAFVPESDLPFVPPPKLDKVPEEDESSLAKEEQMGNLQQSTDTKQEPISMQLTKTLDLPVGYGKALLSPPIENIPSPLSDLSPRSRFIISKVVSAQVNAHSPSNIPVESPDSTEDTGNTVADAFSEGQNSGHKVDETQSISDDTSNSSSGLLSAPASSESSSNNNVVQTQAQVSGSVTAGSAEDNDSESSKDGGQCMVGESGNNSVDLENNAVQTGEAKGDNAVKDTNSSLDASSQNRNCSSSDGEKSSGADASLNGVREDLVKDAVSLCNKEGGAFSVDEEDNILEEADEFEKELDAMLASVKTGIKIEEQEDVPPASD